MTENIDTSNIPDYFEPIVAYRFWKVYYGQGMYEKGILGMGACIQNFLWEPRKLMKAECLKCYTSIVPEYSGEVLSFRLPRDGCSCGIYALRSNATITLLLDFGGSDIFGEVYLGGKILKYSDGYRAEFAYPKKLYYQRDEDELTIAYLADLYGIGYAKLTINKSYVYVTSVQEEQAISTNTIVKDNCIEIILPVRKCYSCGTTQRITDYIDKMPTFEKDVIICVDCALGKVEEAQTEKWKEIYQKAKGVKT